MVNPPRLSEADIAHINLVRSTPFKTTRLPRPPLSWPQQQYEEAMAARRLRRNWLATIDGRAKVTAARAVMIDRGALYRILRECGYTWRKRPDRAQGFVLEVRI